MEEDTQAGAGKNVRSTNHSDVDESVFPFLLKQYYERLFPFGKFYRWLSYGNVDKNCFQNREFSFTLAGDVYIRFLSFANEAEMKEEIIKNCPHKIDLGAVYNAKPKDRKKIKSSEFFPVERELVFDIDMTDYDDLRTCCSGAAICGRCWPFMTYAIKVIDAALREDFGFQHLLWVYSGRRGVHCWVCDKRARSLSQEARSAVAEYLSLVKGGEQTSRKVNLPPSSVPLHYSVSRAISILQPFFLNGILGPEGQARHTDLLSHPEQEEKMLAIIGDEKIEKEAKEQWARLSKGSDKWDVLGDLLKKNKALSRRRQEITLQCTYPRLDINVSKGLNHLLKCPFVVHPKTGRVCVPIDIKHVDDFDPFTVPTVQDLCREIDEFEPRDDADDGFKKEYKKTSLVPFMGLFEQFLRLLATDNNTTRTAAHDDAERKGDW